MPQDDPFKKYGGKQIETEDPFKKYGGQAIEQPEKKNFLSQAGYLVGQSNGKAPSLSQEENQDDIIGNALKPYKEAQQRALKDLQSVQPIGGYNLMAIPKATEQVPLHQKYDEATKALNEATKQSQKLFPNTQGAVDYLTQVAQKNGNKLPENNATVDLALKRVQEKKVVNEAATKFTNFDDFATNIYGGKNANQTSEAAAGTYVDEALNNPAVIEKAKEDPEFNKHFLQAYSQVYNNYPSYGNKKLGTDIGQMMEDKNMNGGWAGVYSNPGIEKTDEAVKLLMDSGKWGVREKAYYDRTLRPIIEAGHASRVIPLTDFAHKVGYSLYEGVENYNKSMRGVVNFLGGNFLDKNGNSLFQNLGLLQTNQDAQREAEQKQFGVSNVEAKGFKGAIEKPFTTAAHIAPMILAGAVGVPEAANMALMFGSGNEDRANQLFKGDDLKSRALRLEYTLVSTTADMFLMKALPINKMLDARKELEPEIKKIITSLGNGEIAQAEVKPLILNAIEKLPKESINTANILTAYQYLHKGLDAAAGSRDLKSETDNRGIVDNYLENLLSGAGLAAFSAFGAAANQKKPTLDGKVYQEYANNYDAVRAMFERKAQENPEQAASIAEKLDNLDHIKKVNDELNAKVDKKGNQKYNDEQKQRLLALSLRSKVANEKIESLPDKALADEKEIKDIEKEKKEILDNPIPPKPEPELKPEETFPEGENIPTQEVTQKPIEQQPQAISSGEQNEFKSSENKKYKINTVNISDIQPTQFAYSKREPIKESISKEGVKVPLIVDKKTGEILDGNNRYSLFEENNINEAKVVYVDKNKVTREDVTKLGKELEEKFNPQAISSGEQKFNEEKQKAISNNENVDAQKQKVIDEHNAEVERLKNEENKPIKKLTNQEWTNDAINILAKYEDKSYGDWGKNTALPEGSTIMNVLETSTKIPKDIKERLMTEGGILHYGREEKTTKIDNSEKIKQLEKQRDEKIAQLEKQKLPIPEQPKENEKPKVEVQQPPEVKKPIKAEVSEVEQPTEKGTAEPPKPPSEELPFVDESGKNIGITHEQTAELRKEVGLPEYEKEAQTFEQWDKEARERIEKGEMPKVVDKLEKGGIPTEVEQRMMGMYIADLASRVDKEPSTENLDNLHTAIKLSDKVGGTFAGRTLVSRKGTFVPDESLAGYFTRERDTNNDAPLTENQKSTVEKEYQDISQANKAYQAKIAELEAKVSELEANKEIKKASREKKKQDYATERKQIIEDIRDKLKKARGETQATILPYAKELIAIAPDVAKLVKNLASEGILRLEEVTDKIHEVLKEHIPSITKKDVNDLIAGVYNERKPTRNELAKQLFELRQQAQLVNKLEKLNAGEEPKLEKKKIQRNQEIESLRKQINEHDLTKLSEYKSRTQSSINKIEEQLKTGDFSQPEKKPEIKLDAEAKALKDKLIELRTKREVRLMKQKYENRNTVEKTRDWLGDKLNIPRTIEASLDYSGLLRQGAVAAAAHPRTALKSVPGMFKASVSQSFFNRFMYDMRNDPMYDMMKESGLSLTDMNSPFLAAREEAFMSNTAEKIPILGKFIKGSERAYVYVLDRMRFDLFKRFAERYEAEGKTYENSEKLYKATAKLINDETGRGDLGKALETAAPILNSVFFSPRLIASRINLLTNWANPKWYRNTPKEVRVMYMKDMLKFIGLGMSILGAAKLAGGNVEDDPRSSDFGKIKSGNTRWDIWGGFQPYIRLMTQMALGQKKSTITGEVQNLDERGRFGEGRGDVALRFLRGKLAPVPSAVVDVFNGRTVTGEKVTLNQQLEQRLTPLVYQDIKDAVKDKGVAGIFTVGLPSIFGIGTQTYGKPEKEIPRTIEHNGKKVELDKSQYNEFEKLSRNKIKIYQDKLKQAPDYKKLQGKDKNDLENMVTNWAIKDAEKELKNKYPNTFKKESNQEKNEKKQEGKRMDRLKHQITNQ